jgi:hypothetical protein
MPNVATASGAEPGNLKESAVGEIKRLSILDLRTDGGTQPRAEIDEDVVKDYAEAISRKEPLPPVVAFFDGKDYWLADGFHRHLAHRKAGEVGIRCEVRQGTQRDAILFSCGANHDHGLRRTPADKRRVVRVLLRDEEWGAKSSRWIADAARVSHTFVEKVRRSIGNVANAQDGESIGDFPTARRTKGGRSYPSKRKNRKPRQPKPNGQIITQEESVPVGTVVTAEGEGALGPTLDGIGLEVPEHLDGAAPGAEVAEVAPRAKGPTYPSPSLVKLWPKITSRFEAQVWCWARESPSIKRTIRINRTPENLRNLIEHLRDEADQLEKGLEEALRIDQQQVPPPGSAAAAPGGPAAPKEAPRAS